MGECDSCTATKRAALREINLYRRLLRMEPLVFPEPLFGARGSQPASLAAPNPARGLGPSLASMPAEILDRIAAYVGPDAIVALSCTLPHFAPIGAAIRGVAIAFPHFYHSPAQLWPAWTLPLGNPRTIYTNVDPDDASSNGGGEGYEPTAIPVRHLPALMALSHILNKHGGQAILMPASEFYIDSIAGALPNTISITHSPEEYGYDDRFDRFLGPITEAGLRIDELHFPPFLWDDLEDEEVPRLTQTFTDLLLRIPIRKLVFEDDACSRLVNACKSMLHLREIEVTLYSLAPYRDLNFLQGGQYRSVIYKLLVNTLDISLPETLLIQLPSASPSLGRITFDLLQVTNHLREERTLRRKKSYFAMLSTAVNSRLNALGWTSSVDNINSTIHWVKATLSL
ncbi:hypothetical protein BC830DRAFT_1103070 [Chytriomyces sp. MP71]|nr:hypothetical protein BC830DRAFT_1103070 [Chytriomyces sp. MP71]